MTDRPILNQVNLVVRDMAASVGFYRRLGFDLPPPDPEDEAHHLEIAMPNGEMSLELDSETSAQVYNASWRSGGGTSVLLGFSLPSAAAVDTLYDEVLLGGHRGVQRPYDAFWGARYAIVADPDGNQIGLMGPVDQARRSWPPDDSPDT